MFDFEDLAGLQIESLIESPYEFNGHSVPRVTEVISKMIEEPSIAGWANSLGFKHQSYNKTREMYAQIGSATHHAIESYLHGQPIPIDAPQYPMQSFVVWWEEMKKLKAQALSTEQALVCELYGGTYDCIMTANGKTYLIDFKTSNHITYKYWLQLSAYTRILREQGVMIDACLILQLSKYGVAFREYLLDLSLPQHVDYLAVCERTFLSLLYGYYHIKYLERRFKDEWPEAPNDGFSKPPRSLPTAS